MKRKSNKETSNLPANKSYFNQHTEFVCRYCSPKTKPQARRKLLANAKRGEIYALCECIQNVVDLKCPISKATVEKLQKYKQPLLKLSQPKRSLPVEERRKLLNQRGSGVFLPLILSSVASYLIDRATK